MTCKCRSCLAAQRGHTIPEGGFVSEPVPLAKADAHINEKMAILALDLAKYSPGIASALAARACGIDLVDLVQRIRDLQLAMRKEELAKAGEAIEEAGNGPR